MKYIDADRLIAEIKQGNKLPNKRTRVNYAICKLTSFKRLREAIVLDDYVYDEGKSYRENLLNYIHAIPESRLTEIRSYLKENGWWPYDDAADWVEQEQPGVDLEKEIIRYQREDMDRDTTVGDVARHFYELGKARKFEEQPFTPPDFDTEVYNWLRDHGSDETRQLIEMTARHFWEMGRRDERMEIGNLSKYGFTVHDEMICWDAVTTFGVENQLDMVIEECAELIDAIQKYRRGRVERAGIITEIADVEIMCQQLRAWLGSNEVASERDRKIKRLAERISKHNKEIKEE